MCEQDRQAARGNIHAELMRVSQDLNRINPSKQRDEARELLQYRRELQNAYARLCN